MISLLCTNNISAYRCSLGQLWSFLVVGALWWVCVWTKKDWWDCPTLMLEAQVMVLDLMPFILLLTFQSLAYIIHLTEFGSLTMSKYTFILVKITDLKAPFTPCIKLDVWVCMCYLDNDMTYWDLHLYLALKSVLVIWILLRKDTKLRIFCKSKKQVNISI